MTLINISDEVMVNPEMISSVEFRGKGESRHIIVRVGTKDHTVSDPKQFALDLKSHGISTGGQFTRI
jgi:hypothetical protein